MTLVTVVTPGDSLFHRVPKRSLAIMFLKQAKIMRAALVKARHGVTLKRD
jgi:hypothetical protein